jgi:transcriptional regulator with PAS, ATPase and Fis domain
MTGTEPIPENATQALVTEVAPVRVRKMTLVVTKGPQAGKRIELKKKRLIIGKGASCDMRFMDPTVSRQHLEVEARDDTFYVRDLGSTNGTQINGTRIMEAFLSPGSRIQVGNVELMFQPVYETPEQAETGALQEFGSLVAASPSMKSILGLLRKAAKSGTTVLLRGETGVGKSALARALHTEGPRKSGPFAVFDCASVAPTLVESELFGVKKGAFTGAYESRPGACEIAHGGTLFIDEICDLPIELQAKLLRVLEDKEVQRLGDTKSRKLNLHVVTATRVNLEDAVKKGRFRRDLYYRIAVLEVMVPPLRNRKEDLPLLCNHFLLENRGPDAWSRFTPALRDELMSYSWPGNVRELRNVLERLECIGPDGVLPPQSGGEEVAGQGLALSFELDRPFKEAKEELIDAFEREYLRNLLERSNGRIAPAAREAGLNRKYFYDLLRKHGLLGR